jgi:sortase A
MARLNWFVRRSGQLALPRKARVLLIISNLLMVLGALLLLYVGAVFARAEYGRYAARGDTNLPAPLPEAPRQNPPALSLRSIPFLPNIESAEEPVPFTPPIDAQSLGAVLTDSANGGVSSVLPETQATERRNTITRIIIPRIDVDSKVVSVGWEVQEVNGQQVAIWQVAEFAVGHHIGSANPGENDNIVLAGHVGGYGKVFRDLINLEPGDRLSLYSNGEVYQYIVRTTVIVTEEGVSAEQQAENARYIAPTDSEVLTLVTCWPTSGPHKFRDRIIVQAVPIVEDSPRG